MQVSFSSFSLLALTLLTGLSSTRGKLIGEMIDSTELFQGLMSVTLRIGVLLVSLLSLENLRRLEFVTVIDSLSISSLSTLEGLYYFTMPLTDNEWKMIETVVLQVFQQVLLQQLQIYSALAKYFLRHRRSTNYFLRRRRSRGWDTRLSLTLSLLFGTICQFTLQDEYHILSGVQDKSTIAARPGSSTGGGRLSSPQDISGFSVRGVKRKANSGQELQENLATMANSWKEMVAIIKRDVDLCQREIVLQELQGSALASAISAWSAATVEQMALLTEILLMKLGSSSSK